MTSSIKNFDIVVIGSGPGGYPAAIKAAQSGKKVALIEAKEIGGTCLNRGCIPSKALIASAHVLKEVQKAKEFGIQTGPIQFDYAQMVDRKNQVVTRIRKSLEGLIQANDITIIRGYATLLSRHEIQIKGQDEGVITAEKIIVATGSEPKNIGAFPFDGKKILDSTDVLNLQQLPKSIVIVGGGVIGCEFASLFRSFGVEVTIIEMMSRILPTEAEAVSNALKKAFTGKGIQIETNAKVEKIDVLDTGVKVNLGQDKVIDAELAIVAVGRQMNTSKIGLDKVGVSVAPNGLVEVDPHMQTKVPGIYAIGDIASRWWLAHVATHQGIVAAMHATGQEEASMHYEAVPSVIFTDPEIATVGMSLELAKEKGFDAALGAFPFQALGKSQATRQTEGFAQIVIDQKTGQILGAQVVGDGASALIGEMTVAIANELTVECITETMHPHPTVTEAWLEAAYAATGSPIHLPPMKKKSRL